MDGRNLAAGILAAAVAGAGVGFAVGRQAAPPAPASVVYRDVPGPIRTIEVKASPEVITKVVTET